MAWKEVIPYVDVHGHAICSLRVTVHTPRGKGMGARRRRTETRTGATSS